MKSPNIYCYLLHTTGRVCQKGVLEFKQHCTKLVRHGHYTRLHYTTAKYIHACAHEYAALFAAHNDFILPFITQGSSF